MGRNKKSWRAKGNTSKPKEKSEKKANEHGVQWVQELKNEKFVDYYKSQNIIPPNEWPKFIQTLREPLPTTFRLAGSRETVHELNDIIRSTYVSQLSDVTFEGEKVSPPVQLTWYPEGLAWQFDVPKSVLRRSPEFKRFHNFLVYETDVGNISRQEAVSMLPPLFLDVQPHHFILDMCAAPGSKTAQLLEALHTPSPAGSPVMSQIPPGLLIANDSDFKRTHLLVHQSSRLPSPALMITNLDASNYPNIAIEPPPAALASDSAAVGGSKETLKFDRILCDVPCSGDGTLRKNVGIWGHWQPMDGNGLHGLQLRILIRAMKLLKPAGRIVYSTCSLNPVENEAVVAAALRAAPDFELVDVSSQLPSLTRRPGVEMWSPVVDKDLTSFPSYSAFLDDWKLKNSDGKAQLNQIKMAETHWPPNDVATLNLARCIRIYPHLQDMGGFFIAVLRRQNSDTLGTAEHAQVGVNGKRAAPQEAETSAPDAKRVKEPVDTAPDADDQGLSALPQSKGFGCAAESAGMRRDRKKELGRKGKAKEKESDSSKFKESPYTFLNPDHPQLKQTIGRLGLLPSFPMSNIFVRHPGGGVSNAPLRSMYLCNDVVRRVTLANDYTRIRLVSAGTRIFTRQDTGGIPNGDGDGDADPPRQQFRILDDGVPVVLPFMPPDMILSGGLSQLRTLLQTYYPLLGSFEEPFQSMISSRENGNHLVRFDAGEFNGAVLGHPLVLPLWKSNASLSLMIDKKSKSALSLRVFGEDITVAGKQILEQQSKNQGRRNAATAAKETSGGQDEHADSAHTVDMVGDEVNHEQ